MDEETKRLLVETNTLAKENNEMLKKLVRAQKAALIYRIFYWAIIVISIVGTYFFVQPYLSGLLSAYTGGQSMSDIFSKDNQAQIQDLIKSLNDNNQ